MPYQTLEYNLKNHIATITLNRPDAFNAISEQMVDELQHAIYSCNSQEIRAIRITGKGKAFCAGGDVKTFAEFLANPDPTVRRMPDKLHQLVVSMRHLPKPIVATVGGVAAGAGFSLALACDMAIASDRASFTLAYGRIGLSPDGSSTFFLPRLIGPARALHLAYTSHLLSAQEAHQLGLVAEVHPADVFEANSTAFMERLAQGPTLMFAKAKALINQSLVNSLEAQVAAETDAVCEIIQTHDFREGVQAFVEKRDPKFNGQ